jgi:glutathione S-transferase
MPAEPLELLQFPHSHYNEKVRWTLAHKGVPHAKRDLLPGPHAPTVLWLTGQTQTPVMRFGTEIVAGSARIIAELERRYPERPLLPADPALRARALALQAWADDDVGPMVRRSLFAVVLGHPDYFVRIFARERSAGVQSAYRALFPVTRFVISTSVGTRSAASIAAGDTATQQALDRVAAEIGPSGHLAGDAFSLADVAVAALLAPAVRVDHPAMRLPDPVPDAVAAWYARWADHPAAAWVRETYRRHRPADA